MRCPSVKSLTEAIERGEVPIEMHDHFEDCGACASVMESLRDETEGLTISVGALWSRARITCPHPDILLAFISDALDDDERDYIRFHLDTVDCAHCQAETARIADASDKEAPRRVKNAQDESMRRSSILMDELRRDHK